MYRYPITLLAISIFRISHNYLKIQAIWKNAVVICFVASLETLLSIEAIDKLDPYNRITPQNRELIAQGSGNLLSGLMGGLPITAVIVRSSANAEAGSQNKTFRAYPWHMAGIGCFAGSACSKYDPLFRFGCYTF